MAEASHNEVFDELSQSFKDGGSSQSQSESPLPTRQFVSKPKEPIPELARYREWLGAVTRSYEAIEAARKEPDVGGGKPGGVKDDEMQERIGDLQKELFDKSTMFSTKELVLRRLQLGNTLLNILFPPIEDEGTMPEGDRQEFVDLCTRNNELSSAILGHLSAYEKTQKELDDVRKQIFEVQKDYKQLTDQLEKKIEERDQRSLIGGSQRLQTEIQHKKDYICILRNILQALIVGSGINWAEDEELQELLISIGQPLKL